MSYRGGTYAEEVLCSSPIGTPIEISENRIVPKKAQKGEGKYKEDESLLVNGKNQVLHSVHSSSVLSKESSINVYSFNPVATQDLVFESSKSKSVKSTAKSNIISLSSEDAEVISQDSEDEVEQDSGLLEISQKDYLASQNFKLETMDPIPSGVSDNIEETGTTNLNGTPSSQVYYELRSAQTPQSSPIRNFDGQIHSSSPILTQHETQPTSSQNRELSGLPDFSMAPSAQLTSFRMLSPKKVVSEKTTPIKSKRNLLVTQESFNIPNLLSPTKSSPLKNHQPDNDSQRSIYCTARQESQGEEISDMMTKTTCVKFKGHVTTKSSSPSMRYETRVIPSKRNNEEVEISDSSDDENDISLIEITKTIKKPKKSILQVPSIPGIITSPSKNTLMQTTTCLEIESQFDEISTEELKRKIIQYGLKPAKSRIKMIESIKEIERFLQEDSIIRLSQSQNVTNSQNIVRSDVFKVLNDTVLHNPKLMEKIYTFEPIETKILSDFLLENGITINYDLLKDWCDRNSICLIEEQVKTKK